MKDKSWGNQSRRRFLKTLAMAGSATAIDWTALDALASDAPTKSDTPVVVVGAGLGGLVAGAYLAKYGFDVTLLEQHHLPGGYATSFEREEFTFDVSLHATVAEHAMPQMILSDLGVWQELSVSYVPELRRIVTPRFDLTLPAKNPEGVKQALSAQFPKEAKGICAFYSEMEQVIAELWQGKQFKTSMMDTLESQTLEQWMSRHVSDPNVKYCMAIFSGYYGLPPAQINALFYAIATGEYLVLGGQYFKARSQDLSNVLAGAIEKQKGKIHYNTRADSIRMDGKGRITGVADHTGTIHPARAVVANCSIPVLVNRMLPKDRVPADFLKETRKRQTSLASFVVWLGLDTPLDIPDYEIDLAFSKDPYGRIANRPKDPAKADLGVTLYDNLFKGYSPKGKSTLSIMSLCPFDHFQPFAADYFNNKKEAYNKEKQRIADTYIQRTAKALIPNLDQSIRVMEAGTPLTNQFYTGNPGGAIYGYDRNLPHLGAKTPVQGLYLSSAWSHGGGYTPVMMAGRQAAKTLLQDFRKNALA